MAHIFKQPTNNSKGIIVYTHKELEKPRWSKLDGPIPLISDSISSKYYLGMHYGSVPKVIHPGMLPKNISFVMAGHNQMKVLDERILHISINSRNFIPDFFKPRDTVKFWDILNISRNHPHKHLDIFINSVKQLYDAGYNYKVLLVVATEPHELEDNSTWPKIVKMYEDMFTIQEKDNFTLMRLSCEFSGQGLPMRTIAHFYNSSKIFSMICHAEGESRVIHEALASGLPVVCYKNLTGGGTDFLNSTNSVQFDDYRKLADSLRIAVQKYDKNQLSVDIEQISKILNSNNTIGVFKNYLEPLFVKDGSSLTQEDLINCDYLQLRLPGHFLEIPWYDQEFYKYGADILTMNQFDAFKQELIL